MDSGPPPVLKGIGVLMVYNTSGSEGIIVTHVLGFGGRSRVPLPCSLVILRYQVGISSEQALRGHATLPFSSLPHAQ